jgi:hypothetical protein
MMKLARMPDDEAAIAQLRAICETARAAGFGPGFNLTLA